MTITLITLSLLKLVTLALGCLIVYLALKAYRATQRKPILWLGIGIGIMTLGSVTETILFQLLGWGIDGAQVVEAVMILVAFAVLVYSLYAK